MPTEAPVEVDKGSVKLCSLIDDEHGFTASYNRSLLPLLAVDLGGEQRIWRGGYLFQQVSSVGVVEGRNGAVDAFLESSAEWLFFVDSDMGFEPDSLERLLAAADPVERPIVGGLCFGYGSLSPDTDHGNAVIKHPFPTIFDLQDTDAGPQFRPRWGYTPGVVQQCAATGAAMLLVHRTVFERMADKFGDGCWFNRMRHPEGTKLWGEDTSFCYRAAMLSIPVFVHAGVQSSHLKAIYVTQTTYMNNLVAQPATDNVAVIVPVLNRPQNAEPFMRSLRASTGLAEVYAACSEDDDAKAWEAAGATVVRTEGTTFAEKVNEAYEWTEEPWVLLVGDDVRFRAGWLDHAQQVAVNTGAKVIGTNDLANPRVTAGEHATHMMIARDYIDEQGASWDGPGVVCHEGYGHWYVDDEIVTVARQRGVWAPALASVVEHLHPMTEKSEMDDTYKRGQASAGRDKIKFSKRQRDHAA
jgi:glycosyltransferase involved in cell wall biosynthesis